MPTEDLIVKTSVTAALEHLTLSRKPLGISPEDWARTVLQGMKGDEPPRATLALLRLLAMGQKDIAAGRTTPLNKAVKRMRVRHGLRAPKGTR